MHDIFSREPDPLDGMLAPPSLPESDALRQAVYAQTRRVLRRRRRVRQLAYAATLFASFAAGALAMRTIPRPAPEPPARSASEETPRDNPPASPVSSALAREWDAFDSQHRRGELYRRAGDSYLQDENDLQSALRCYGNALGGGTEQDLTISADDSWLLMAIKDARQKEKSHAKNGG
jgi:hypothetical protein